MMYDQMIQGIQINWEKIPPGSYLRNIDAIQHVQNLEFHKPVTFFVGENGSGKSTLLEAIAPPDLIRRAVQKIITFPRMIPILNCVMRSD